MLLGGLYKQLSICFPWMLAIIAKILFCIEDFVEPNQALSLAWLKSSALFVVMVDYFCAIVFQLHGTVLRNRQSYVSVIAELECAEFRLTVGFFPILLLHPCLFAPIIICHLALSGEFLGPDGKTTTSRGRRNQGCNAEVP